MINEYFLNRRVIISLYDANWLTMFNKEAQIILDVLEKHDVTEFIQHIIKLAQEDLGYDQ